MSKNAAGIEVFSGFNITYPEYEVVTPHTIQTFTIRTMTVDEEQKIKSSMTSPRMLTMHLDEVIWGCIIKKPDHIKTFDDFLNYTSIKDRDALLYGLYHVTYKDISNYEVECTNCEHHNMISVDFLKSFKIDMWEDDTKDPLKETVEVNFEIAKNVKAIIKLPTTADEFRFIKESSFMGDDMRELATQTLFIDKFVFTAKDGEAESTVEDRDNIIKGFKSLPSIDKSHLQKMYLDTFDQYGVELKTRVRCMKCGHEEDVVIDLIQQFFRSLYR